MGSRPARDRLARPGFPDQCQRLPGLDIEIHISDDGLPGAAFWQQVLGWLAWGGLAGSLASMLIGGAVWGLSHANGHSMGASRGKTFALGGMAGAILVGLAATIVNTLSGIG